MSIRQPSLKLVSLIAMFIPWQLVEASTGNAKQWFVKEYAAVWKNTHSLKAKALIPLYHSQGFMRVGDQLILWRHPESIELLVQELKRQGWQNAKVLSVQSQEIGPTTQSLNVVWRSDYKKQTAQISCEWYLVEKLQEHWKVIGQRYLAC